MTMTSYEDLDGTDKIILGILSGYELLTVRELWYEFGEDDAVTENLREDEIAARLESLASKGFLESVVMAGPDGKPGPLGYRLKKNEESSKDETLE
jgi:hypothetical protein